MDGHSEDADQFVWSTKPFADLSLQELYDILKLRQDVFIVEQQCYYDDIDASDQDAVHMLITNSDARLIGYARVFEPGRMYAEAAIGRIIVAVVARGDGLGTRLVQRAVAYCRTRFPDAGIRIAAQSHLQDFYAACGFETVSAATLVDGIPHVDMVWRDGSVPPAS